MPPPDRRGGGSGLYYCEPPNTVLYRSIYDDSRGYVSAGVGQSAADPIFRALFSVVPEPSVRLCQFAYLMYRAKKDYAAYCGGPTNAVFIKDDGSTPVFVAPICMERAERLGSHIDSVFESAVSALFSSAETLTLENLNRLAGQFQSLRFYSIYEEEVV